MGNCEFLVKAEFFGYLMNTFILQCVPYPDGDEDDMETDCHLENESNEQNVNFENQDEALTQEMNDHSIDENGNSQLEVNTDIHVSDFDDDINS